MLPDVGTGTVVDFNTFLHMFTLQWPHQCTLICAL